MKEHHAEKLCDIFVGCIPFVAFLFHTEFPEQNSIIYVSATLVFLYTLYRGIQLFRRSIPLKTNTKEFPWFKSGHKREDFYIIVPRNRHKKGSNPDLRITNYDHLHPAAKFKIHNFDNGSIKIVYDEYYYTEPPEYLEFEIKG